MFENTCRSAAEYIIRDIMYIDESVFLEHNQIRLIRKQTDLVRTYDGVTTNDFREQIRYQISHRIASIYIFHHFGEQDTNVFWKQNVSMNRRWNVCNYLKGIWTNKSEGSTATQLK